MFPNDLWTVIPVGGEAKRLKPLTAEVSKAVIRIFNRPLVEFAIAELAQQGVRNFVFGVKGYLNYRSLFDYFRDGLGFSTRYGILPRVHIKYQPHVEDFGSADSVRINLDYYHIDGPVMVVQGDNLFQLNLMRLLSFHEKKKSLMTVVLTPVEKVESYGIVDINADGRIRRFIEKPREGKAPSKLANTGIYLLSPKVKEILNSPKVRKITKERRRLDFGLDFIPFLIEEGRDVFGYVMEGEWYDVGTPDGYLDTILGVPKSSRSNFYLGEPLHSLDNVWIQGQSRESIMRKADILKKVKDGRIKILGPTLIGRHCQIGDGTTIKESCIDNFCTVGEGSTIIRSAIMDRAVIEEGAIIQDSIVGRHVRIKSSKNHKTEILNMTVIGDDVIVGEGCVMSNTRVFPHRIITDRSKIENLTIH